MDLRARRCKTVPLLPALDNGICLRKRFLERQLFAQGMVEIRVTKIGPLSVVCTPERSTVRIRRRYHHRARILQFWQKASRIAGGDHHHPISKSVPVEQYSKIGRADVLETERTEIYAKPGLPAVRCEEQHQNVLIDIHHITDLAQQKIEIGPVCQGVKSKRIAVVDENCATSTGVEPVVEQLPHLNYFTHKHILAAPTGKPDKVQVVDAHTLRLQRPAPAVR